MKLLKAVAAESDVNMMDASNLATIWGGMTNVFFSQDLPDHVKTQLLLNLINYHSDIFAKVA